MIQSYKFYFAEHAISRTLLIASLLISFTILFLGWLGWALWALAILLMVAWMPIIIRAMNAIYRRYKWLALLFVLLVAQTFHFFEHIAQFAQSHFLGWVGPRASGMLGALNNEWVHFLWNSWVLLFSIVLIFLFRKNVWMMMLFLFAIWHEIEHIYIMSIYLRTHIEGTPGLIARGGFFGGGLPISRLDLHFLYAVLEQTLLLLAYYSEMKKRYVPSDQTSVSPVAGL